MTATRREKPTAKQMLVYRAIVRHWGRTGVFPTVRELCGVFGIASTNGIACHLRALAAKGWIDYTPQRGKRSKTRNLSVPELVEVARRAAVAHLVATDCKEGES